MGCLATSHARQSSSFGLLGLAFKPDTDDLRDAPSLYIASRLLPMGARVRAYDPSPCPPAGSIPDVKIRYCDSPEELASGADALVRVTEWQEFRALDLVKLARSMATPVLVDGRNIFHPEAALAAGFDYTGIGRSNRLARQATPGVDGRPAGGVRRLQADRFETSSVVLLLFRRPINKADSAGLGRVFELLNVLHNGDQNGAVLLQGAGVFLLGGFHLFDLLGQVFGCG